MGDFLAGNLEQLLHFGFADLKYSRRFLGGKTLHRHEQESLPRQRAYRIYAALSGDQGIRRLVGAVAFQANGVPHP
jgi:hypothetical protein